jgi:hypothetical protein
MPYLSSFVQSTSLHRLTNLFLNVYSMNLAPSPKPLLLTPKDEEILQAIAYYRYVTSLDIAHLLFRPTYMPYVRSRLSRLAGNKDLQPNFYLYRFWLPSPQGNRERIFTLGEKGQQFLKDVLGQMIDWRFQPSKLKFFSYSNILHHLLLTRFLVAATWWSRNREDVALLAKHTSYELLKNPPKVVLPQKKGKKTITVIPDAWVLFDKEDGKFAVLFELDRGMEHGAKFKEHVRARLAFIRSGKYKETFGVPGVIVAYVTTGQTPAYRNTRMKTMNDWTREVLEEINLQHFGGIFRFTSVEFDTIYIQAGNLFEEPVWLRPDTRELGRLFE